MVEARIISQKLDFITTPKSTCPIRMATSTSTRRDKKIRDGLAHEKLARAHGQRADGFHGPVFVLPGDDERREQGPHDHDDDGDDAGNDEVAAFQVFVEPDPEAALDRRPDPLPALAV